MRVLIAPDKFKGTLTARAAARAMAAGWHRVRPQDQLVRQPISDGGDGFGEVLAELRGARPVSSLAMDAAGRRCRVRWWWDAATRTAIIESARVIGLAQLPPRRFHPLHLDTRGLGLVLRAAARRGARRCVLGIGGSATNDGGFGLAVSLGWQFLNRAGQRIGCWTDLVHLAGVRPPAVREWPLQLVVAVDVQNRLLGPHGCTRVYGPQKGLRPSDFAVAEACLRRLATVVHRTAGRDLAKVPGAGAAGGLGFGLLAFAGGRLVPGFALMACEARLPAQLRRADLVLTGEGCLDRSSLMGKGTGELASCCRQRGIPCVALSGRMRDRAAVAKAFTVAVALTDRMPLAEARRRTAGALRRLVAQVARQHANSGA